MFAWMDFGEFVRSLPMEEQWYLEILYAMCWEMAPYEGAFSCDVLSDRAV